MQENQSPLLLLSLLQRFTNHSKKIKQIHSLILTNGCLLITTGWTNTLLYNSLIRTYGLFQPNNTFILFRHMLNHNAPPNNLTFPFLIKAAATLLPQTFLIGKPLGAQCFRRGVWEDPFVRTSFVSLFSEMGDVESARKMFDETSHPILVSRNAMIDAFAKNGDMGSAVLMFSEMDKRDIFTWTSLINGYARNERFHEAIESFGRMMMGDGDDAIRPDEATFVCALSCCANLEGGKAVLHGKQIHCYMVKNESQLSVFMETALITFYGKMACFGYAERLFCTMVVKEVCTWNAMICSLALQCREKDAFHMFIAMKKAGFPPNGITFVGLLSACSRTKLVSTGLEIFNSMHRKYGIVPEMEHYGCIVDLLGRAGMIREAYEFLEKMPFAADASVLGALLGACRIHGAVELAGEIGQRILDLQPRHCGRYVQLSTIYAGAERWDSAAAMRRVMVDVGVQKVPGYSMVHQR